MIEETEEAKDQFEQLKTQLEAGGAFVPEDPLPDEEVEKLSQELENSNGAVDKANAELPLTENDKQKLWEQFMRKIKAHEVTEALINRALEYYKIQYDLKNPDEPIEFKMYLKSNRQLKQGIIFDVSLILEMSRGPKLHKLSEKRIQFHRVREVRDEAGWKFSLYQSMLDSLITEALNFFILKQDVKSGRVKQDVPPSE